MVLAYTRVAPIPMPPIIILKQIKITAAVFTPVVLTPLLPIITLRQIKITAAVFTLAAPTL